MDLPRRVGSRRPTGNHYVPRSSVHREFIGRSQNQVLNHYKPDATLEHATMAYLPRTIDTDSQWPQRVVNTFQTCPERPGFTASTIGVPTD